MEEKTFVWTKELCKKMIKIRFENNWLFERTKQPWIEFHKILIKKGFPKEMTVHHVRKKWSYQYDLYKIAKKSNKTCNFYKLFDKHFGKKKILDKYSSWSNEWRIKLIACITEVSEHKMDHETMWRAVENAMRSQDLPEDCCIQDIKGLWHYIKVTFVRKYRLGLQNRGEFHQWPLYDVMLEYFNQYEPESLVGAVPRSLSWLKKRSKTVNINNKFVDGNDNKNEFHWSKDITETFIQIRLQNDWLFREKSQPWLTFVNMLKEEYGFPSGANVREVSKKWTSTYAEYQKAKATNNTSWIYYYLFELYLGEGSISLNPIQDWEEEWVLKLINARTNLEKVFQYHVKDPSPGWRLVEKRLRTMGLPLTHSLLDLTKIWAYLCRTFKVKRKFAIKGMLTVKWPYYEAMAHYSEVQDKHTIKVQKVENDETDFDNFDDYEDDIKLLDLKVKLKQENESKCRACANVETYMRCVDIFEYRADDGTDLASKLKAVGGIEVEKSDRLPTHICYDCLQELENAYNFRRKCQSSDQNLRATHAQEMQNIKTELLDIQFENKTYNDDHMTHDDMDRNDDVELHETTDNNVKQELLRKKKTYKKYEYWKVCEICGKNTRSLRTHMDTHNTARLYSCEVCDKKFKYKSGLSIHRASHNPKPRKTCEVCGKTFHVLAQYRRHFAYHANERKFECETCGKRFNSIDILKVHIRMHTDERPFTCSDCGKTFRTAGCVSRHRRIVHTRSVKKNE